MSTASLGRAPAKAFFHPGYCTRALPAAHHQSSAPYHLPRRSRKEPSASKNRRIFLQWPEDTWGQLIFFFNWGWCWLSGRSFAAPWSLLLRYQQHPPPSQSPSHGIWNGQGAYSLIPQEAKMKIRKRNTRARERQEEYPRSHRFVKGCTVKSRNPSPTSLAILWFPI